MSENTQASVKQICERFGNDRTRMMDIVRAVQGEFGCVSQRGHGLDRPSGQHPPGRGRERRVVLRFPVREAQGQGRHPPVQRHHRPDERARTRGRGASSDELGIGFGETTPDGKITLEHTPCIGMCDQAPAALVNDVVVTELSTRQGPRDRPRAAQAHGPDASWSQTLGDGNNAHDARPVDGQEQHPQGGRGGLRAA